MAVFTEYAVDDNVKGKVEEPICKVTVILLMKDHVSLEANEEDRWNNYGGTLLLDNTAYMSRGERGLFISQWKRCLHKSAFILSPVDTAKSDIAKPYAEPPFEMLQNV